MPEYMVIHFQSEGPLSDTTLELEDFLDEKAMRYWRLHTLTPIFINDDKYEAILVLERKIQ